MNNKLIDLTGQSFGIWLVIEQAPRRDNKTRWLCQCQGCGVKRSLRSTTLRRSVYAKCDGRHLERFSNPAPMHRRKASGYAAGTERYNHTRRQAQKRGFAFALSHEAWSTLVQQDCHYCGIAPLQVVMRRHFNGVFVCNGLDRKDSTQGYTLDNCVACCGLCNLMKQDLAYTQFLKHIAQIAQRHPIDAQAMQREKHRSFGNGGKFKMANIDQRKRHHERKQRNDAVAVLRKEGKTIVQISTILNLSTSTVHRTLQRKAQEHAS